MRKHFAFLLSIIIVAACGFYVQASDIAPEVPLSAQWVPNAVKITFDSNGGGIAPATQVYTYGIERSLPNAGSMSKSGYHFIGWAETPTATSPTWYGGNISSEAFGYADGTKAIAKTLYAVWEANDTATAADVKKGLTAHINDTQVSGTMPTYDSILKYLNAGESYTLEPGYYAGGTIQGNTLASQTSANASASTIRSGYTAWVNGNQITGTYTPPTALVNVVNCGDNQIHELNNGKYKSYAISQTANSSSLIQIYTTSNSGGYNYYWHITTKKNCLVLRFIRYYGQTTSMALDTSITYSANSSFTQSSRVSAMSNANSYSLVIVPTT